MSIYAFKPTFLYIKQHTVTGKMYFGKTICNPETYLGSGRYWKNHIKKYGEEHVINLWYCLFYDKDECVDFATTFSDNHNIVESKEWANEIIENGIDGWPTGKDNPGCSEKHIWRMKNNNPMSIMKVNKGSFKKGSKPIFTEERNRKIAQSKMGMRNPNFGKTGIADHLNKKDSTCIHCGLVTTKGNIVRWHNDNCKVIHIQPI